MFHSAIMAIDIANHHIGIALAYYRQLKASAQQELDHSTETESTSRENDMNMDSDSNNHVAVTTSITALPPIPYMSSDPYHPSYAFLHHHLPGVRNLDRVDRTMEVADQLAQLAIDRKVKGILVRWPGGE